MSKKKIGKFIFGAVSLAAACGAAFYFVKDYLVKKNGNIYEEENFSEDFDGFEDENLYNSREYVTINITHPDEETTDKKTDSDVD